MKKHCEFKSNFITLHIHTAALWCPHYRTAQYYYTNYKTCNLHRASHQRQKIRKPIFIEKNHITACICFHWIQCELASRLTRLRYTRGRRGAGRVRAIANPVRSWEVWARGQSTSSRTRWSTSSPLIPLFSLSSLLLLFLLSCSARALTQIEKKGPT